MKNRKQKRTYQNSAFFIIRLRANILAFLILICFTGPACLAVTSQVTRHSTGADMLKGEVDDVVISSTGQIELGRAAQMLVAEFEDVWSINSIAISGGAIYVGTSPNGGIYKYSMGKLTEIYSAKSQKQDPQAEEDKKDPDANEPADPNEPADVNQPSEAEVVETEDYLANEHIFAMATDVSGRLLAGISGRTCRLSRFDGDKEEIIFEPDDANYIFAITVSSSGNIYLGTGPEGKIYKLDSFGKNPKMLYDCKDKNILSLAVANGAVYAGSDGRGLIYKIDRHGKEATVLYDSDADEITALLFADDGSLYATATSAKILSAQKKFASQMPTAGRPEAKAAIGASSAKNDGGMKLNIANTKKKGNAKSATDGPASLKGTKPGKASYIYKITTDGFVTELFSEAAVFFCLAKQNKSLFLGTGNDGRLFTIDPDEEQQRVIYEDKQASQIIAVLVDEDNVYLGTANPPKLLKIGKRFADKGTYTSALIDAGQPARWGKLQIEADIPKATGVFTASRSGNVGDVNDPTYSPWTDLVSVTEPIQLRCPTGRFCQYKLVLKAANGKTSPVIREIAVAHTVPNVAPKVDSVTVERIVKNAKEGFFKISCKASDENKDTLIYRIDFRKAGRKNWIELEDQLEADNFKWDAKTVEDGRYEIRVTADDQRSNTTATKLTAGRVSDAVVVDNTGPMIKNTEIARDNDRVSLKFKASDELSAIGGADYTIDSNADWIGSLPKDSVFDTTEEDFEIVIEDIKTGTHILSLRIRDDIGNTTYKSFEF